MSKLNDGKAIMLLKEKASLSEAQIVEEIEAEYKKFTIQSDLISKTTLLLILLKKYGIDPRQAFDEEDIDEWINLEKQDLKIEDICHPMKRVTIKGLVSSINAIKEFTTKKGTPSKVGSFFLSDETGMIRVTLWGKKADFLTLEEFKENAYVVIKQAYTRINEYNNQKSIELHLGSGSLLEVIS